MAKRCAYSCQSCHIASVDKFGECVDYRKLQCCCYADYTISLVLVAASLESDSINAAVSLFTTLRAIHTCV